MIRWTCGVKIKQQQSTEELRRRLDLQHVEDVLRWNRLRLSGHLYRQEETLWTKKIMKFAVDGPTFPDRPIYLSIYLLASNNAKVNAMKGIEQPFIQEIPQ